MFNASNNFQVITFGCRLNFFETEVIKDQIKTEDTNNFVVFNTCSVTAEAERKARQAIRKLKRRNAPGPDEIPTELLKELKEDNIKLIQELFTQWWNNEDIDTEKLKTRVVLIYKKGDTNKFENYRPISLLNTLYKIFAAILHKE